jgi:hypothetical protein
MTHEEGHSSEQFTNDLRVLDDALKAQGVDDATRGAIRTMALSRGHTNHRDVVNLVQAASSFQNQKNRETAAGGSDFLEAMEKTAESFDTSLSITDLEELAPTLKGLAAETGLKGDDLAASFARSVTADEDAEGLSRGGAAGIVGGSFTDPPPAPGTVGGGELPPGMRTARTNIGEMADGRQVETAKDGTTWVGGVIVTGPERDRALSEVRRIERERADGTGAGGRVKRFSAGRNDAGQRVETNDFGDVWLDGIQVPTGSQAANNALNQASDNGGPSGSGTGSGRAASPLQHLGTDLDGFEMIFNPNTGLTTKGKKVGFAQIDPRDTAREQARQFNEVQQLDEGEFIRDVLSGGRNFLTAALITRGGQKRDGQATQADIISGGFAVDSLRDMFGTTRGGGGAAPTDAAPATTADNVGGLATASAVASAGGDTGLGPLTGGTSGLATDAQISPDGFTGEAIDLAQIAREEAPPAVKNILAGEEVGFLSTPGSTPLASPSTLRNLSQAEQGALDTTLQVTDQRTLDEFRLESDQRFRAGGFRGATRA